MERKSVDRIRRKPSGAAVIRPELTTALYTALFEEWAQNGFAGISLERVADRAGAGKAAIYRRWSSKQAFVCDALQSVGIMRLDFTDQGSLEADIRAYIHATRTLLRHPLVRQIVPDLIVLRRGSNELSELLDGIIAARRQFANRLLDRAIARKELHERLNRELALDLMFATLHFRMVIRSKNFTRSGIDRLVIALGAAIKSC